VIARVLLALVALAAAVWVGASLHSATLASDASGVVRSALNPHGVSSAAERRRVRKQRTLHAIDLLERARDWAPWQAPVVTEAGLLANIGDQRRSVELLDDLVRREPDNPEGWATLARVLQTSDPARAEAAGRRALELSPPVRAR